VSILSQALSAQADANKPWATGWGDLIESAHASGDLSASDWKRYAEQAVAGMYVIRYRTRVTSHMPFSYALDNRGARVGSRPTVEAFTQVLGLVVDDVERMNGPDANWSAMPLSPNPGPGGNFRQVGGGQLFAPSSGSLRLGSSQKLQPWMLLDGLQPGPHDGYARVQVRLRDVQFRRLPTTRSSPGARSSVVVPRPYSTQNDISQLELKLPIHLDIVPAGQPLVRAFEMPSLHDAIAKSLRVQGVRIMSSSFVSILISCDNPPVNLSFKVLIRDGAREWPLGSFAYSHGQSSAYAGRIRQVYGMLPQDFTQPPGPTVDIVFRADPDPAVMFSPDITDYWSGEDIVIKDAPLSAGPVRAMPLPRARPATQAVPRLSDGVEYNFQRRRVLLPVRARATF
jgi:hypothetical protein